MVVSFEGWLEELNRERWGLLKPPLLEGARELRPMAGAAYPTLADPWANQGCLDADRALLRRRTADE